MFGKGQTWFRLKVHHSTFDSGVLKAWKHPRLSSFFLSSLPQAFTVALERGVNGESFSVVENVVDRFVRKSFQRIIRFRERNYLLTPKFATDQIFEPAHKQKSLFPVYSNFFLKLHPLIFCSLEQNLGISCLGEEVWNPIYLVLDGYLHGRQRELWLTILRSFLKCSSLELQVHCDGWWPNNII